MELGILFYTDGIRGNKVKITLARPANKTNIHSHEKVIDEHLIRLDQLFAELLQFALSNTEYPNRRQDVVWRRSSPQKP